ncbi:hypothetical protein ACU4GR_27035 [Methylobacterium oryzae CBMB20]
MADTLSLADGLVELLVGARRQEIESGSFAPVTGFRSGAYDRSAVTPALGLVVRPTAVLSLYANRIEELTALTAPNTAVNTNQAFPPAARGNTRSAPKSISRRSGRRCPPSRSRSRPDSPIS